MAEQKEPRERAAKATEVEVMLRLLRVKKLLLEGTHRGDIIQLGADEWGIGDRQMDEYIAKARKEIKEQVDMSSLADLEWHAAARAHLYNKSMEKGDLQNARQVLDSLAKLQGIMVERRELTGKDGEALGAIAEIVFIGPEGED